LHGGAGTRERQDESAPAQATGRGGQVAVFGCGILEISSKALKPLNVQIDGPCPNITPPWPGHSGRPIPTQQWPKNINRCPHALGQVIRYLSAANARGVNRHGVVGAKGNFRPKRTKDFSHAHGIADVRHILEDGHTLGRQGSSHQR
jgi:hypothetical protein